MSKSRAPGVDPLILNSLRSRRFVIEYNDTLGFSVEISPGLIAALLSPRERLATAPQPAAPTAKVDLSSLAAKVSNVLQLTLDAIQAAGAIVAASANHAAAPDSLKRDVAGS